MIPAIPTPLLEREIVIPVTLKISPKTADGMKIQLSHQRNGIRAIAHPIILISPRIKPASCIVTSRCFDFFNHIFEYAGKEFR
jgi:hypothetical protein